MRRNRLRHKPNKYLYSVTLMRTGPPSLIETTDPRRVFDVLHGLEDEDVELRINGQLSWLSHTDPIPSVLLAERVHRWLEYLLQRTEPNPCIERVHELRLIAIERTLLGRRIGDHAPSLHAQVSRMRRQIGTLKKETSLAERMRAENERTKKALSRHVTFAKTAYLKLVKEHLMLLSRSSNRPMFAQVIGLLTTITPVDVSVRFAELKVPFLPRRPPGGLVLVYKPTARSVFEMPPQWTDDEYRAFLVPYYENP